MLGKLAVRDVVIAAVLVAVWTFESRIAGQSGALFWVFAALGGVACGVMGFLIHEWGHLAGSKLSGSVVHVSPSLTRPLLFHFDTGVNDRRQFLWLSFGGYLASAVWLSLVLATADPSRWSGRIAMGAVVVGVLGTIVVEVPTTLRVWRGAPLPTGVAFRKP